MHPVINKIVKYVSMGDQDRVFDSVTDAIDEYGILALDQIIAPTLRIIGDSTSSGILSVGHEHLASEAIRAALFSFQRNDDHVRSSPAANNTKRVLTGALAGDFHDLATHMVRAWCELNGVKCLVVGANTPVSIFLELVELHNIQVVAVTISEGHSTAVKIGEVIDDLVTSLPSGCCLAVGGSAASSLEGRHPNLNVVASFSTFHEILDR